MTPAEAIKLLDLLPHATREQIEERFVEQRALLEEKAAKALTPKLQAQYREALARITEAYETLVLAEEGMTLPSLQSGGGPATRHVPAGPASAPAGRAEQAGAAAADSFGPWFSRQVNGIVRGIAAIIPGSLVTGAFSVAVEQHYLVLPPAVDDVLFLAGVWILLAALPGLAWWVHTVRSARRKALAKFQPADSPALKRSPLPLCLALLTLAAGVVAWFYIQTDNRESELAIEAGKRGQSNVRRGKWTDAVADYGEARALRPYYHGYPREHDQAQQSWVDALAQQLKGLPPDQAYEQLTRNAVRPRLWLTSPTRERYAKLFAETAARMGGQTQELAGKAESLMAEGKLSEARMAVTRLRPLARLTPGFQVLSDRLEIAEFEPLLSPADDAKSAGNFEAAYALLAKVEAKTDTTRRYLREVVIKIHVSELFQAGDKLANLILKGEFVAADDGFIDLEVMVERMAKLEGYAETTKAMEIDPAELVAQMRQGWRTAVTRQTVLELTPALAAGNAAQAQAVLEGQASLRGHPLLITGELLVKEKSLSQFLDYLSIIGLRTVEAEDQALAALPALALVQAASAHFEPKESAPKFLAEGYHAIAQALLKNGQPGMAIQVQRVSVRAGGAPDPALEQAALKLFAENNPVRLGLPPILAEESGSGGVAEALRETLKTTVEKNSQGLVQIEDMDGGEGEQPRRLVLQPAFTGISTEKGRDAAGKQLTHHLNHAAGLQLRLVHGALPEGGQPIAAWTAALRYSTVQITGDIQRGVPARQAVFLTDPEVAERLKLDLSAKIQAQAPVLLWQLAQAVHEANAVQLSRDSSRIRLPAEFECGWVAFWEKCGLQLSPTQAEADAREFLWLPAAPAAAAAPFVPRTGWLVENSLGLRFTPVPGTRVLFATWETRVQDFAAFVKETSHAAVSEMISLTSEGWQAKGNSWRSPGFVQDVAHPVCGVNRNDAMAFCAWLTRKERAAGHLAADWEYRLPTVAEWRRATGKALASGPAVWPHTGSDNLAGSEAAVGEWPKDFKTLPGFADGFARTAPVGWFSSNEWGIYDLEGNVSEWCEDPSPEGLGQSMGFDFTTAAREAGGLAVPRLSSPDMRHSGRGFRLVIAPVENR